ncbi:methyltransferase [Saccharopolyspora phatthalungensis]|uniref:Methyltransferase n=1 Tax=Saccharopolyspora phatthalungensis TaxID=664693 RepID=A0A840QIH4_9PSEU|nr:methyltransferase [Saccharopolyspora phatthalungensis]MBB5158405.1 hypothetical protein [Saccharopolyspora phatthalungensis]
MTETNRSGTQSSRDFTSHRTLLELTWSYINSELVEVMIELRLADLLGSTPLSSAEVAAQTDTHPPSMRRLLRALTAVGLLVEAEPDRFFLTPAGKRLRTDTPDSLYAFVAQGGGIFRQAWTQLRHSLRTGSPAFDRVFGVDLFHYLTARPELSTLFNEAMSQGTRSLTAELATEYEFSRYSTVVDVGGGNGTLLAGVLSAHPGIRGVLFDTAEGVKNARTILKQANVAERCEIRTGDFFASIPDGGDLYLLKSIIHDWDDQRSVTILANCRKVMGATSRLLILEVALPPTAEDPADALRLAYLSDLHMLVSFGGAERSLSDFETLLSSADLRLTRLIRPETLCPFTLIEAAP